jgi:eukaryotic-like serine/threonine-protein kinase
VREGESGPLSRLTFPGDGSSTQPVWTPSGREVAYLVDGAVPRIAIRRADGSSPAETLLSWDRPIHQFGWAPDGTLIVAAGRPSDLHAVPPGGGAPQPLLRDPSEERKPSVSPDGRWLAYVSPETGRSEVYVRPLADPQSSRTRISTRGGTDPGWSRSGREILFTRRAADGFGGEMVAVDVLPGGEFASGQERVLFTQPRAIDYWGAAPDGSRFVLVRVARPETSRARVIVVENWFTELLPRAGR